ncbi:hypothetical protein CJP46_11615 [Paenibacillus sp. XY044]|nr:hypothetical protein CJP46_11615 [Paenibacillus sp. XY044]
MLIGLFISMADLGVSVRELPPIHWSNAFQIHPMILKAENAKNVIQFSRIGLAVATEDNPRLRFLSCTIPRRFLLCTDSEYGLPGGEEKAIEGRVSSCISKRKDSILKPAQVTRAAGVYGADLVLQ